MTFSNLLTLKVASLLKQCILDLATSSWAVNSDATKKFCLVMLESGVPSLLPRGGISSLLPRGGSEGRLPISTRLLGASDTSEELEDDTDLLREVSSEEGVCFLRPRLARPCLCLEEERLLGGDLLRSLMEIGAPLRPSCLRKRSS